MSVGRRRRRTKKRRIGRRLLLFLMALVLLAFGPSFFNLKGFFPSVDQELSKAMGRPVRIGRLTPMVLPPGIALEMVELPAAAKGAEPPLLIEGLRLYPRLLPLLKKEIVLRRLELHRPRLRLERDRQGRLLPRLAAGPAGGGGFGLAAESILLTGGSLSYVDRRAASRMTLHGIDLQLAELQVANGEGFSVRDLAGRGRLTIREAKLGEAVFSRVEADFRHQGGVLRLEPLAFTTADCRFRGKTTIDSRHSPLGISLEQVVILPGKEGNSLRIEGGLTLAPGAGFPEGLGGTLAVRGRDLAVAGYDLDTILAQYDKSRSLDLIDIGSFFVAGPFGPVLTQAFDAAGTYKGIGRGRSTITRMIALWDIHKGVATARDVALATERHLIAGLGQLDLVHRRFRDFRVAVLDRHRCAKFGQTIRGSFADPDYGKAELGLKSIAGTVTSLLAKARNMVTDCEPFYRGSLTHPLADVE